MTSPPDATSNAANRFRSVMLTVGVLAAVGALAGVSECAREQAHRERAAWPPEADTRYLPPSEAIRLASLGHRELAADLLAARTNIYFGSQMETKGEQQWLEWYLNAVVDLDPRFEPIYSRGAAMLTYSTKELKPDKVLSAVALLGRGIEAYPDSWDLYFQLGFNLYYELPQLAPKDPRVDGWKRQGVEALRKAALFSDVPSWLPSLVAKMLTEEGEQEMAIKHLERVYAATSDEEARQQIQAKLLRLMGAQYARRFEARAKHLERVVQTRYPYAPEAFSLLVGRRLSPYAPLADTLTDPADR